MRNSFCRKLSFWISKTSFILVTSLFSWIKIISNIPTWSSQVFPYRLSVLLLNEAASPPCSRYANTTREIRRVVVKLFPLPPYPFPHHKVQNWPISLTFSSPPACQSKFCESRTSFFLVGTILLFILVPCCRETVTFYQEWVDFMNWHTRFNHGRDREYVGSNIWDIFRIGSWSAGPIRSSMGSNPYRKNFYE